MMYIQAGPVHTYVDGYAKLNGMANFYLYNS